MKYDAIYISAIHKYGNVAYTIKEIDNIFIIVSFKKHFNKK